MTGIYRGILERIERRARRGARSAGSRCPAWEKAWLAARSLAGVRHERRDRDAPPDG